MCLFLYRTTENLAQKTLDVKTFLWFLAKLFHKLNKNG